MRTSTTLLAAALALTLLYGCKSAPKPPPASEPTTAPSAMAPELEQELTRMRAATDRLAQDNNTLRQSVDALGEAQSKNADLGKKLQDQQRANIDLQAANDKLKGELAQSLARLDEARGAAKDANANAADALAEKYAEQIKSLADKNAQLTEELHDLRTTVRDAQKARQKLDWDQLQQQLLNRQFQNALLAWLLQQRNNVVEYYPLWIYPPARHRGGGPWPPPHHGGTIRTEIVDKDILPGMIDGGKLFKASTIDGGKLMQGSDINGGSLLKGSDINGGSLLKGSTVDGGKTYQGADAPGAVKPGATDNSPAK